MSRTRADLIRHVYSKDRAASVRSYPASGAVAGYADNSAAAPPSAGGPELEYEIEVTATTAVIRCLTLMASPTDPEHTLSVTHDLGWASTESFLTLAVKGTGAVIRDFRLVR